eukprot:UN01754
MEDRREEKREFEKWKHELTVSQRENAVLKEQLKQIQDVQKEERIERRKLETKIETLQEDHRQSRLSTLMQASRKHHDDDYGSYRRRGSASSSTSSMPSVKNDTHDHGNTIEIQNDKVADEKHGIIVTTTTMTWRQRTQRRNGNPKIVEIN